MIIQGDAEDTHLPNNICLSPYLHCRVNGREIEPIHLPLNQNLGRVRRRLCYSDIVPLPQALGR
jgi:hypothetical protein